jgi:hypothetical protein
MPILHFNPTRLTKVCRYSCSISQSHQWMQVLQFNLARRARYASSISQGSPRHASTSAEHASKKSHFNELSKAHRDTCSLADDSLCAEMTQQGVPVRQSTFIWLSKSCQYANLLSVDSARRASLPIHFHSLSKACQYANLLSVGSARRASMPIQFQLTQQGVPVRQSTFCRLSKACLYDNSLQLTQHCVPVCQSLFTDSSRSR